MLVLLMGTGCIELPDTPPLDKKVLHLEQNWTADEREEFYHISQGTVLMKADWFLALEQPEIKFVGTVGMLRDDDYMARFGFLPDEKSARNPQGLPVGLAVTDVVLPVEGERQTVVGLTCAACHTGQLEYGDTAVRIDGGGAQIDVTKFQEALGASLMLTAKTPTRFRRFADRVLGANVGPSERQALKQEVTKVLRRGVQESLANRSKQLYDGRPGGFGRTDALAKIGNYVFGTELDDANLDHGGAPVKFPQLWDSPWFDWSQYNGSISQPMVRNIGEALGVRAQVNLDPRSERFLDSTVDIEGLHRIENLLAGGAPLQGLQSPRWPKDVFGELVETRVAQGAELYRSHCQKCHLPPLQSPQIWESENWIGNDAPSMTAGLQPPKQRRRYLNLNSVNLGAIGTDPGQATQFFQRYVKTNRLVLPSLTSGPWNRGRWEDRDWYKNVEPTREMEYPETVLPAGVALQRLTVAVAERYYDKQDFNEDQRELYNGYRNPAASSRLEYRPRPLNGVWASPPYLHNGSVRTIFQLLSPLEERDRVFYTGTRQYDPRHLGFKNIRFRGAFRYDTSIEGNHNTGHLFDAQPLGDGVIGPLLQVDERYQLIEFLKSLGPAGVPPATFLVNDD
ncbi:di-heme-cytochrome C peroxidase [Roseimaritima ulvae]|nr:di-heme-cytochrome C peroxidase [Roseimaritima ulvae]